MQAAPGPDAEAKLLDRGEVLDLIQAFRAVPGVTEAAARVVVR